MAKVKARTKDVVFDAGTVVTAESLLLGVPKGIRQVLKERGLYPEGKCNKCCACPKKTPAEIAFDEDLTLMGRACEIEDKVQHNGTAAKPCCAIYILSQCHDFLDQRGAIEEYVVSRNHLFISVPKFHPECNFIERYWGYCKRYLREHCDYKMASLRALLEPTLQSQCSLSIVRGFASHAWRWMSAYRRGLTGRAADFVMKKFKGHRGIPESLDTLLEEQLAEIIEEEKRTD